MSKGKVLIWEFVSVDGFAPSAIAGSKITSLAKWDDRAVMTRCEQRMVSVLEAKREIMRHFTQSQSEAKRENMRRFTHTQKTNQM